MNENDRFKVKVFEVALKRWNNANCNYVIVHGLEGYPDRVGRDIDILAAEEHQKLMIDEVIASISSDESLTFYTPNSFYGNRVIVYEIGNGSKALEIHLITHLKWMGFNVVPSNIDKFNTQGYVSSFTVQYVKRALLPSLANNRKKLESNPSEFLISEEEEPFVRRLLLNFFSNARVDSLFNENTKKDSSAVFAILRDGKFELARFFFKKGFLSAVQSCLTAILRKYTVLYYPNSPIILARSPAVSEMVEFRPKSIFLTIKCRHIKTSTVFSSFWIIFKRMRFFFEDRKIRARQGVVIYSIDENAHVPKLLQKILFDSEDNYEDVDTFISDIMDVTKSNYHRKMKA